MPLAANLHESLFAAIEKRFAIDGDLTQLCGRLYIDFVPDKDEDGNEPVYPLVVVTQGQEGGSTEECVTGYGVESVDERFSIHFELDARTRSEAAQVAWQIVKTFEGWEGDYDGVKIGQTSRTSPPWVGSEEQGVYSASIGFIVSASAVEE